MAKKKETSQNDTSSTAQFLFLCLLGLSAVLSVTRLLVGESLFSTYSIGSCFKNKANDSVSKISAKTSRNNDYGAISEINYLYVDSGENQSGQNSRDNSFFAERWSFQDLYPTKIDCSEYELQKSRYVQNMMDRRLDELSQRLKSLEVHDEFRK